AGTPDVWLDGELHRLQPGDAVGFPAGTGLGQSFLNNTAREVHLLVVGEARKAENRVFYPRNPEQATRQDWWSDPPPRAMGDHDGLTDTFRARRGSKGKSRLQSYVAPSPGPRDLGSEARARLGDSAHAIEGILMRPGDAGAR